MPKQILVVDDEPDIVKVVAFRLEARGYEVLTAGNGKEALEVMQERMPDLVLLDLRLPDMDGSEVCRRVRSKDELKNIPIVILTASIAEEIVQKMKSLGADGYIVKPFTPEELLNEIEKLIRKGR